MLHLVSLKDWSADLIREVLDLAQEVKRNPAAFEKVMHRRTLLMIFEKPSLRTRVSFETGMSQMGGHAIFYDTCTSPLGAGKESLYDTVKTVSRYVDLITARLFEHSKLEEMAREATVPVINALTDYSHPCQVLGDLFTIQEKKGKLEGLTLAYLGDSRNNVTHSLLSACPKVGMSIRIGCPPGDEYAPAEEILREAAKVAKQTKTVVQVTHDPQEAVKGADIVYTDSWMSYHIPPHKLDERVRIFSPYQVNVKLMKRAARDAIF
ncbi:MAG: ornithine carbamoyltransferase, partial [Verrucomicrobiota bacterium]